MKEKIKKLIKTSIVLGTVYVIGRFKGMIDVTHKYKDCFSNLDGIEIGLFTKNEKPGVIGTCVPKDAK